MQMSRTVLMKAGAAAAAILLCGSALAFADDDARRAILELRENVKQLQSDLTVTRNAQMQLMTEINSLKERNRQLTGRVEELSNAITVEKRSTRDLFSSLDQRVEAFEPQTVVINGQTVTVDPKEKEAYDAAVLLMQDGKFKDAASAFSRFVKQYDKSPYRPEALYWWGTSAFAAEQYKTAISSQNQLIREFPKHVRVPDAMLLVGSAQAASGSLKAARATFQKVVKAYPNTDAAKTAQARIKALK